MPVRELIKRTARNFALRPRPSLKVVIVRLALVPSRARVLEPAVTDGVADAIPAVKRLAVQQLVVPDVAVPALHLPPLAEQTLNL